MGWHQESLAKKPSIELDSRVNGNTQASYLPRKKSLSAVNGELCALGCELSHSKSDFGPVGTILAIGRTGGTVGLLFVGGFFDGGPDSQEIQA